MPNRHSGRAFSTHYGNGITYTTGALGTLLSTVNYTYGNDAWGNPVSITGSMASTLGEINPIRYRGYYYDTETGFYYLQSRYYDPVIGRFISPDSTDFLGATGTTLSCNLFAYCENNAVANVDPSGALSIASIVRFVKNLGAKSLKVIKSIWNAFVQSGKINLKPFEIVIDAIIGMICPSFSAAFKLISYKAISRELVRIGFKHAAKNLVNTLAKFGVTIGLNTKKNKN